MARSRNIKPGLFKNEILGEADPMYSLLFIGLWTLADKQGRLENRPKRIRAELFPYRFDVDVSTAIAWLKHESFITVYEVDGNSYIQIAKWEKHQSPHHKEIESEIPSPSEEKEIDLNDENQQDSQARAMHDSSMIQERINESASTPLIPDSLNSDSLNLIPDQEPEKKVSKKKAAFCPPTIEEIKDYIEKRGSNVDAKIFFDYFDAGNWIDSKGQKVKSWKQKLITWESNNQSQQKQQSSGPIMKPLRE